MYMYFYRCQYDESSEILNECGLITMDHKTDKTTYYDKDNALSFLYLLYSELLINAVWTQTQELEEKGNRLLEKGVKSICRSLGSMSCRAVGG